MKKLLAVTLIGLSALTASAAISPAGSAQTELESVDEALVNARIDARQNELMRALLAARRASHGTMTASR